MVDIIVAIVVGVASVLGVVLTNKNSNDKVQAQIKTQQAVTDEKIEELTREVHKHNEFAERIPVLEEKAHSQSHRIDSLEKKVDNINKSA